MTKRQAALLTYHRDLVFFATVPKTPVFVILDLDDSVGMEIASFYQPNCAEKRAARIIRRGSSEKESCAVPGVRMTLATRSCCPLK